jgi:hypothetical protein
VVATIDTLNVQNCSVTAWAFATLRHDDDELFEALLERVAANIAFCEPQNVANTLWAYARLGRPLGRHAAAFKVGAWSCSPPEWGGHSGHSPTIDISI